MVTLHSVYILIVFMTVSLIVGFIGCLLIYAFVTIEKGKASLECKVFITMSGACCFLLAGTIGSTPFIIYKTEIPQKPIVTHELVIDNALLYTYGNVSFCSEEQKNWLTVSEWKFYDYECPNEIFRQRILDAEKSKKELVVNTQGKKVISVYEKGSF